MLVATESAEERIHDMWRTAQIRGEWFGGGVENDIIARAKRTQREQIDAMLSDGDLRDVLELPFRIMSQTGMQRG
jgi:hypothetical protein